MATEKKDNDCTEQGATPIEVYCPICGFHEAINCDDERLTGRTREEKLAEIRRLQSSDTPFFTCRKCDNPRESAKIIEIR